MRKPTKLRMSLRQEIFFCTFVVLTAIAFILSGIYCQVILDSRIKGVNGVMQEYASKSVTKVQRNFEKYDMVLRLLARTPEVIHGSEDNRQRILNMYDFLESLIGDGAIIYSGYEDGRMLLNDYMLPDDFDPTSREWYRSALKDDSIQVQVYLDYLTREWTLSQSTRLVNSRGEVTGVVCIDCSNESINEIFNEDYIYDTQSTFLVNPDGVIIIHPNTDFVYRNIQTWIPPEDWRTVIDHETNALEYSIDGVTRMGYFMPLPGGDFWIGTSVYRSEVLVPILRGMFAQLIVILFVTMIVSFLASHMMADRYAQPIMQLGGRIQRIAEGHIDDFQGSTYYSNHEINQIAENIEQIVSSIVLREYQRKKAEYLSYHDSMTGLYNRRYYEENQEVWEQEENYPLCIISCDINGLKLTNDMFGHNVGDLLICATAECLKRGCRIQDSIIRLGGDEFVVVMPHVPEESVDRIIERLKEQFYNQTVSSVLVSASIGYALKQDSSESFADTLNRADQVMYLEKRKKSAEMKRKTLINVVEKAEEEGFVRNLSLQESSLLSYLGRLFFPDSGHELEKSYHIRNFGGCSLFHLEDSGENDEDTITQIGSRMLNACNATPSIAKSILYYTEHWDGSGKPHGLVGDAIPVASRILCIVDAYCTKDGWQTLNEHPEWYDPGMLEALRKEFP